MANDAEFTLPQDWAPIEGFPPGYTEKECAQMILGAFVGIISGNALPLKMVSSLAMQQNQVVPDWDAARVNAERIAAWAAWRGVEAVNP